MKEPSSLRFSRTINFYHSYRPGYPEALLSFMRSTLGLNEQGTVADIGSGTGKLTALFLKNGNTVFAIEPNDDMRTFAENQFSLHSNFHSLKGTAEQTGLPTHSMDIITAAQAFHWFDPKSTFAEWKRVLRPDGWALLIWNKRADEKSVFMQQYNQFLEEHSTDYNRINLRKIDRAAIEGFYKNSPVKKASFEHQQLFDLAGLIGRYRSCSYAYEPGHADYEKAIKNLTVLFDKHHTSGQIPMYYRTEVYYGKL